MVPRTGSSAACCSRPLSTSASPLRGSGRVRAPGRPLAGRSRRVSRWSGVVNATAWALLVVGAHGVPVDRRAPVDPHLVSPEDVLIADLERVRRSRVRRGLYTSVLFCAVRISLWFSARWFSRRRFRCMHPGLFGCRRGLRFPRSPGSSAHVLCVCGACTGPAPEVGTACRCPVLQG